MSGSRSDRPLRILHIITGLGQGGAERQLSVLAAELARRGYVQKVLSLTPGGVMRPVLSAAGIELASDEDGRLPPWALIRKVIRERQAFGPDVVHSWMYHANVMAALTAGAVPVIWGIRHSLQAVHHLRPATRLIIGVGRLSARRARYVVYNSLTSRIQHAALGYPDDKAVVVSNGIDTRTFRGNAGERARRRGLLGIDPATPVIGFLGRKHPDKGWDLFIDAAAELAVRRGDLRFVMAGTGLQADDSEVSAHVRRAGLDDRLLLLGPSHEPEGYLAMLDLFVSSSRSESFPNVLAEAMARELPCVATSAGDSPRIVPDDRCIARSFDGPAIASRIEALLGCNDLAELAMRGRQKVLSEYSVDAMAAIYERLYWNAVGRPGPSS